jgi:hypothetical protein
MTPRLPTDDNCLLVAGNSGDNTRDFSDIFGKLYLFPDCGNSSLYKVFEYLPVVPAKKTLSVDYFTFDITNGLGLPILCHKRKVMHVHGKQRKTYENLYNYWFAWTKSVDYFRSYADLYDHKLPAYSRTHNLTSDNIDENFNSDDFADVLGDIEYASAEKRAARLLEFIGILRETGLQTLVKIAASLEEEAERMLNEINEEYKRHIELVRLWPEFMKKAQACTGIV